MNIYIYAYAYFLAAKIMDKNKNLVNKCISVLSTVVFLATLIIIPGCAAAQQRLGTAQSHEKLTFSFVNTQTDLKQIRSRNNAATKITLGVNNLYSIDNNAAWNQQKLGQKLLQLKVGALRYPGGEVADNYDWETNSSERSNKTLAEKQKDQPLDYLGLLNHAAQIGVSDLFFVVNVEGAFLTPGNKNENILNYAKKAARWVSEVKKHGYKVKYWEIGNEAYLTNTAYPLTADEYAQVLKVFYKEMKQADPLIQIGAIGPSSTDKRGFGYGLTQQQLAHFRQPSENSVNGTKNICQRKEKKGKDCIDIVKQLGSDKTLQLSWWDTILTNAKDSFDFAAIHDYTFEHNVLKQSVRMQELSTYLNRIAGRPIELNITEWNMPPSKRVNINTKDMPLDNAIKLGNYLAAGVSHAIFWPIRYKEADDRALLTFENSSTTEIYKVFALISPVFEGSFVNQLSLGKDVYFLQTLSNQKTVAMFVNRGMTDKLVSADLGTPLSSNVEIEQISLLTEKTTTDNEKTKQSPNSLEFKLPPKSITILKFK